MERRLEQLREVIRDKENLVTELRQELEEKDREVISVRMGEGVQGLEDEKQALMEDFYRKSRDLDAARDRATDLERERSELQGELDAVRGQLEQLEKDKDGAADDVKATSEQLKEAERAKTRLEGKVELSKDMWWNWKQPQGGQPDLRASEAKVKALTMELTELKKKGSKKASGGGATGTSRNSRVWSVWRMAL